MYLFAQWYTALATFVAIFLLLSLTQYRNHSRGYVHDGLAVRQEDQQAATERILEEFREVNRKRGR